MLLSASGVFWIGTPEAKVMLGMDASMLNF